MQWCLVMTACVAVAAAEDRLPWWKTATLYQVYPRSFKDSDGDGTGDLKGITQNADYFKEIGVDAIWLSPIFKSPMVDNGYDISDFRNIDPLFGTLDDFRELVAKMRSIGVKLLMDMVPNHSSNQHVWFNKSLNSINPYTDYYVWSDGKIDPVTQQRVPPNNWRGLFSGLAWEWREERQQYYLHQFTVQQPDFNYRNPAVVKELDDIMMFWMDMGVDGFRMDAVIHLVEGNYSMDEPQLPNTSGQWWSDYNHTVTLCQPEDIALQSHWDEVVYNYSVRDGKDRAIFVEAYAADSYLNKFFGYGNTDFTAPFNFRLLVLGSQELRAPQLRDIIQDYLSELTEDQTPNWVIGNHDNSRIAERYGADTVDSICMLQGVVPGVKVVYYGEEIGMRDTYIRDDQTVDPGAHTILQNGQLLDRDPFRTPLQWDDSLPNGGFSSATKTWLPVNPNYWWLNIEAQRRAGKSHLKVFRDVNILRKDPVLQRGSVAILAPNNDTLVVVRSYKGSTLMFVFNTGTENVNITTQDFFSPLNMDLDMSVEVASVNSIATKGSLLGKGSATLSLRSKSAVILRSPPSSSASSARRILVLPVLLTLCIIMRFIL